MAGLVDLTLWGIIEVLIKMVKHPSDPLPNLNDWVNSLTHIESTEKGKYADIIVDVSGNNLKI
jgi:hypothetical protein